MYLIAYVAQLTLAGYVGTSAVVRVGGLSVVFNVSSILGYAVLMFDVPVRQGSASSIDVVVSNACGAAAFTKSLAYGVVDVPQPSLGAVSPASAYVDAAVALSATVTVPIANFDKSNLAIFIDGAALSGVTWVRGTQNMYTGTGTVAASTLVVGVHNVSVVVTTASKTFMLTSSLIMRARVVDVALQPQSGGPGVVVTVTVKNLGAGMLATAPAGTFARFGTTALTVTNFERSAAGVASFVFAVPFVPDLGSGATAVGVVYDGTHSMSASFSYSAPARAQFVSIFPSNLMNDGSTQVAIQLKSVQSGVPFGAVAVSFNGSSAAVVSSNWALKSDGSAILSLFAPASAGVGTASCSVTLFAAGSTQCASLPSVSFCTPVTLVFPCTYLAPSTPAVQTTTPGSLYSGAATPVTVAISNVATSVSSMSVSMTNGASPKTASATYSASAGAQFTSPVFATSDAGPWTATLSWTVAAASYEVSTTIRVVNPPALTINVQSISPSRLVPGSLVSMLLQNSPAGATGLTLSLGGVSIAGATFDASVQKLSFHIPSSTLPGSAAFSVQFGSGTSATTSFTIASASAPAITSYTPSWMFSYGGATITVVVANFPASRAVSAKGEVSLAIASQKATILSAASVARSGGFQTTITASVSGRPAGTTTLVVADVIDSSTVVPSVSFDVDATPAIDALVTALQSTPSTLRVGTSGQSVQLSVIGVPVYDLGALSVDCEDAGLTTYTSLALSNFVLQRNSGSAVGAVVSVVAALPVVSTVGDVECVVYGGPVTSAVGATFAVALGAKLRPRVGVSPASCYSTGGCALQISVTDFASAAGTTVTIGGAAVTLANPSASGNQITYSGHAPAGAAGATTIVATAGTVTVSAAFTYNALPTTAAVLYAAISPASVIAGSGATIAILLTNFVPASSTDVTVTLGGVVATDASFSLAGGVATVKFSAPISAVAGSVPLAVFVTSRTSNRYDAPYTVQSNAPMYIDGSLTPSAGGAAGTTGIFLRFNNMPGITSAVQVTVSFSVSGGPAVPAVVTAAASYLSTRCKVTFNVPSAGALGTSAAATAVVTVTVVSTGLSGTFAAFPIAAAAAPVVQSVAPMSATSYGGVSVYVSLSNAGTASLSAVFGGVSVSAASATVQGDGSLVLRYVVPAYAGAVAASGTSANAYVLKGSDHVAFSFTYTQPPIAAVAAMSVTTGSAGDVVAFTVTGLDATLGVVALFGSLSAALVSAAVPVSGGAGAVLVSFEVPAPAAAVAAPTPVQVQVYNVGRLATAGATTFTYLCTTCGQLILAEPASGSTLGGTQISISASNFLVVGVADLKFSCNGVDGRIVGIASSSLDYLAMTVATGAAPSVGSATCTLSTAGGGTSVSFAFSFYAASSPVVFSVSSASGNVFGGDSILVTVLNIPFPSAASDVVATFGTVYTKASRIGDLTQVQNGDTVANSVGVYFTVPAASSAGDVTLSVFPVAQPALVATTTFTYMVLLPVVDRVQPSSGPATGGTNVLISLHDFPAVSVPEDVTVAFGAAFVSVISASTSLGSTTIIATTPAGAAGAVSVTVTYVTQSPNVQGSASFTYLSTDPVFLLISPSSGPAGTMVDIMLSNMLAASYARGQFTVSFGGVAATVSDVGAVNTARGTVTISVIVPAAAAGESTVTVLLSGKNPITLPVGSFGVAAAFVSYIYPATATTSGGVQLSVSVTGWTGVTSVTATFSSALTSRTATGTVSLGAAAGVVTKVPV